MTSAAPVVPGVDPEDQRRVSVVCHTVRMDVSLPAHLELVAVIPELLQLLRDHARARVRPGMPGDHAAARTLEEGGSWRLSRVTGATLGLSETLARQRVHDGEILVLDRRPVPTPAPLFDDVLEGMTDPRVGVLDRWTRRDSSGVTALVCLGAWAGAELSVLCAWWATGGLVPAAVALLCAVLTTLAVVVVQRLSGPAAALVAAIGAAVASWAVTVTAVVPGSPGPGHAVAAAAGALACAAGLLVWLVPGPASPPRHLPGATAALAAGTLAVVALPAALLASLVDGIPPAGAAAGAVVLGLIGITLAPRWAVLAGRVPVPPVPAPGEDVGGTDGPGPDLDGPDVAVDAASGLPGPRQLRASAEAARAVLTGVLSGCGTAVTAGALICLTAPAGPSSWAVALAAVSILVLALRGLAYTDRAPAAALLTPAGLLALGMLLGAALSDTSPAMVVGAGILVAGVTVLAGVVLPRIELSPGVRSAVGVAEAILVVSVVPLAAGVLGAYHLVRAR